MKFAIAEKLHEKYLEDVVKTVSQDEFWRERLFEGEYNDQFLITFKELEELPYSLWSKFSQCGLEFFVSKIDADSCPEKISEGLIILKFVAKEFPHVVRYLGVNQEVV